MNVKCQPSLSDARVRSGWLSPREIGFTQLVGTTPKSVLLICRSGGQRCPLLHQSTPPGLCKERVATKCGSLMRVLGRSQSMRPVIQHSLEKSPQVMDLRTLSSVIEVGLLGLAMRIQALSRLWTRYDVKRFGTFLWA